MTLIVRRLQIRGAVQGVGFRWAMVEEARRLGLRGWVRNRRDGSVEAVVAGPADAVEQVVQWAYRGPPSARVDAVDAFDVPAGEETGAGFEQRSTG